MQSRTGGQSRSQSSHREPRGHPHGAEKLERDRAQLSVIEPPADHQDAVEFASRAGDRSHGRRLPGDEPACVGSRQQTKDGRRVVWIDEDWLSGRLQHERDGRGAGQRRRSGGGGRAEAGVDLGGFGEGQHRRPRTAATAYRLGHHFAHPRDGGGLHQLRPGRAQEAPMVLGLREHPGVQANEQAATIGRRQRRRAQSRDAQPSRRGGHDGLHRAIGLAEERPSQGCHRRDCRRRKQAPCEQAPVRCAHDCTYVERTLGKHCPGDRERHRKNERVQHGAEGDAVVIAESARRRPKRLNDAVQGDGGKPEHDPPDQHPRARRFLAESIACTPADGR